MKEKLSAFLRNRETSKYGKYKQAAEVNLPTDNYEPSEPFKWNEPFCGHIVATTREIDIPPGMEIDKINASFEPPPYLRGGKAQLFVVWRWDEETEERR